MSRLLFLILSILAFLLVSCGSSIVRFDDKAHERGKSLIVFIPGFYGSALADEETDELYFLTAWKAIFSGTPLALATPDLGVKGARPLKVRGILKSVRVIPGIYSVDAYGEAVDFLTDLAGDRAELVPFAYDWRQDLFQTVKQLDQFVDKLRAGNDAPIYLVSHSLGSVITSYYLRYGAQDPENAVEDGRGAEKLKAVVLAGGPFQGAAIAFRNLQTGTSLGSASTPLNQISLSTFPSLYHLMPTPDSKAYRNARFEPLTESLYSAKWWKLHSMGLLRDRKNVDADLLRRRETANETYLKKAELYWKRVNAPTSLSKALPLLAYVGVGHMTFSRVVWSGDTLSSKGAWLFSKESINRVLPKLAGSSIEEDGDGAVTRASATPPRGVLGAFKSRVLTGPAHHEKIFSDEVFQKELKTFFESHGLKKHKD